MSHIVSQTFQWFDSVMKKCTKCKQEKPLSDFSIHRLSKDGLNHKCRACNSVDSAFQREKSPRSALRGALHKRLAGRPTEDPVTIQELMDIWKAQHNKCALSGYVMTWGGCLQKGKNGQAAWNSISIDRIDPSRGYEKNNVRLVCHGINSFRGQMTDKKLLSVARALVRNMSGSEFDKSGW